MTDTQWPRFIVFHQEKATAPHQYSGSVHAPDAELALLNARDVFVRRPNCVSLWIVPASAIFSKTAEELSSDLAALDSIPESGLSLETYAVFQKMTHKGAHLYKGEVQASTPEDALQQALASGMADSSALVWWLFPARVVTRSTSQDIEVFFAPAIGKFYRDQGVFHTEAIMQKLKSRPQDDNEA